MVQFPVVLYEVQQLVRVLDSKVFQPTMKSRIVVTEFMQRGRLHVRRWIPSFRLVAGSKAGRAGLRRRVPNAQLP